MRYNVYVWDSAVEDALRRRFGDDMTDMAQKLCHIANNFEKFDKSVELVTEAVNPLGMFYGDTNGGFGSGTKWYNEKRTLWLRWNTWWNFFSLYIMDEENATRWQEGLSPIQYTEIYWEPVSGVRRFFKDFTEEYIRLNNGPCNAIRFPEGYLTSLEKDTYSYEDDKRE